jgi:hypothetical protein
VARQGVSFRFGVSRWSRGWHATTMHCALNPMYFENTGHMGRVAEDDIQRISMTLPKFPVYFGDVILSDPAHMSGFGCQGTVHGVGVSADKRSVPVMKVESQEHKSEFADTIESENETSKDNDDDEVYCPEEAGANSKRKRDDDGCLETSWSPGSR